MADPFLYGMGKWTPVTMTCRRYPGVEARVLVDRIGPYCDKCGGSTDKAGEHRGIRTSA